MAHIMTKQGSLDNIITYEHYCDTVADLSNIPSSQITLGSVAIVVNDEDEGMGIYIANSQKEWTPISTSISGGGSGEVLLDLIHVCSSSEYDSVTKVPTVENAESNKIYLVPNSESGNNAFDEWIYANEAWERFGGGSINVPVTDVQVNGVSVVTNSVANILTETENSVPIGGTTGQILTKTSNSNYDTQWANPEVSASEFDELKKQIVDMSPTTTVGPATYAITEYETPKGYFFADAAAYNAESVLVEINPVQEGSGDPTPDNVRPISGWTETTITHYGDKYDPDLITITFPSEAGTVYCGTLNVTNGELVVNSELVTVSSFSTYYGVSSHGFAAVTMNSRYTNRVPLDKTNLMVGNQMKYSTGGWQTIPAYSYCGTELDPKVIVYVIPGVTTIYEANAWLASLETPLQVMLWLETPITYHLTPQEIKLARYVNELSADTGDVTLTYRQDVGLYESITRELVDEKVQDVQVNGTSVLNAQNIANIPVADNNNLGVVRPAAKTNAMTQGVGVDSNGALWTEPAPTNPIASNGIPTGGTTGQVIKKTGSADYAAGWSDVALNDLSDVNVSPNKVAVLTYQPGIRKWLAGTPSPFQIGTIYEHYDEELQDLDGKGYIDLTNGAENPSGNPVFSSYCYDSTSIHIPTDGLFEVYWTTNTGAGLESIYLIDRAAGTPFDHAMYRYDYDSNYGIWVEAPLANTNEVIGMWTGTQAQYDALATKDAHTVYFIQE